jgi:hypothetical protein
MQSLVPILIPIVALLIPIFAIVGGIVSQMHANRLKADQRMAMLARGIPIAEIEAVLNTASAAESNGRTKDPMRSLGNARRAAIVLISVGLGLVVFFFLLEVILQVREVLAGAAAGLIPLAIGIGFLIDYNLQKRDLARFGLEIAADARRD